MTKKIIFFAAIIGMMFVVGCTQKSNLKKPFTSTHVFTAVYEGT